VDVSGNLNKFSKRSVELVVPPVIFKTRASNDFLIILIEDIISSWRKIEYNDNHFKMTQIASEMFKKKVSYYVKSGVLKKGYSVLCSEENNSPLSLKKQSRITLCFRDRNCKSNNDFRIYHFIFSAPYNGISYMSLESCIGVQ